MILRHPSAVDFDPSKKDHRKAVRDFMKRKSWADTTLRFTYDPAYGSVTSQVQSRLLEWYMYQEENRTKKPVSA